jgi:tetratricopeptide (TPR) repeat protein
MRYAVGSLLVLALAAGRGYAQPTPEGSSSALAEQLFNQGRDLIKANQWTEACPKFEASLRYDPVLGTRLNLATCYEHIGKLASAWGLYRESIELARKAGDPKRAEYAQKQAAALEPRLPKLAISVPASPPAGFAVKRDDTAVDAGALGVALYVDPGTHRVTASAPGFEPFTVTVTLTEGKTETLAIPNLVGKPVKPADAARPAKQIEPPAAPASPTRKYVAYGLGGAGVVAIGVSLVFGAKARSSFSDAQSLCGNDLACKDADAFNRDKQLVSDAHGSANLATGLFIGGLAAVGAGVVVYLTAPRAVERRAARLVPVPHEGGAGLALTGTF